MCGIAGAIDLAGTRTFSVERLLAMTAALTHRGPDDEHVHVEPGLALGVRRLAIVDIPDGRQPLSNEGGDVWVAVNGELFDYPELRRRLLSRGHRFRTHCDTEAWVHLYEDHGTAVFEHTFGQYAVSLWDRTRRTLLLARDRMGICPLYYTQVDRWLLWASEVKALLASGLVAPEPDVAAINHFFTFFCSPTSRSFFQGVTLLLPGQMVEVRAGRIHKRQYWDLDFPDRGSEQRFADDQAAVQQLEHLLRHAVVRRLRGDVPVVCYLSGGLDSTVTLALCAQQRAEPMHCFTVGLDGAGPDERSQASESAAVLGSRLTTRTFNRLDIATAFPDLIHAAEGPVMDTSCACLMRLAEEVHQQGYKVAMTGEGADEALAGYVWFKSHRIGRDILRPVVPFLPRMIHEFMLLAIGGGAAHRPRRDAMNGVRTVQQEIAELMGQTRESLFCRDLWARLGDHCPFDDLDLPNARVGRWHPLNQSLYVGYKVMLPGLLMMAKGDRAAMNSSVETRYPYLDEEVVQFCAAIHPYYKLRGLTNKWLLRQVAARVVPPRIAARKKTMFRASMADAFLGPERPLWVDQLLSPESLRATGLFREAGVNDARRSQAKRRITPRRSFLDMGLMSVIATQLWMHHYCGGGLADLPAHAAAPAAFKDSA